MLYLGSSMGGIAKPLKQKDEDFLKIFCEKTQTKITTPIGITKLRKDCFRECKLLEEITILPSVSLIEERCFMDCPKLKTVKLPNTLIEIDYLAFSGCSSLTSITIPSSVTTISTDSFSGCSNMTIYVDGKRGCVTGAPWGASKSKVVWLQSLNESKPSQPGGDIEIPAGIELLYTHDEDNIERATVQNWEQIGFQFHLFETPTIAMDVNALIPFGSMVKLNGIQMMNSPHTYYEKQVYARLYDMTYNQLIATSTNSIFMGIGNYEFTYPWAFEDLYIDTAHTYRIKYSENPYNDTDAILSPAVFEQIRSGLGMIHGPQQPNRVDGWLHPVFKIYVEGV